MVDTHCHLNSSVFAETYPQVIDEARKAGVSHIMIPGTDVEMSERAMEIAAEFPNIYAAIGIHPHHVFKHQIPLRPSGFEGQALNKSSNQFEGEKPNLQRDLDQIKALLVNKKVVAVGEVGIDRYYYRKTKYADYEV